MRPASVLADRGAKCAFQHGPAFLRLAACALLAPAARDLAQVADGDIDGGKKVDWGIGFRRGYSWAERDYISQGVLFPANHWLQASRY